MAAPPRASWTIPLAEGPVSATADRMVALVVAVVAAVFTAGLLSVSPDGKGHGTHEKFGMDKCGWPDAYGMPCPTCGCTTAATELVHGNLVGAFLTQPFGAAVALIGLIAGIHAWACLLRGRSFADALVRLPFWTIAFGLVVLLFASWGYKCLIWAG